MQLTGKLSKGHILTSQNKNYNIYKLLSAIYYADNNHINIKISNGNKIIFQEDGLLNYGKTKPRHYQYCIEGNNLQEVLNDLVNFDVDIELAAEALKGVHLNEATEILP